MIALALVTGGTPAYAQLQTGNLYGTVTDNDGAALPGARVVVEGLGAPRTQFTGADGEFRFLGLDPGVYSLTASLEGFATLEYEAVNIQVGRNTTLELNMAPAVEDVITVTSESPLLDSRKISKGTTLTQIELEKIPTARDPWVIVQQTPGVLVDRINVGGNESGQQSNYVSPGTNDDNSVWAVDGVVITDMGAIGSSPSYYNFDSFEEMQVSTGGTDVSLATGGVTMNMVTKRGTNQFRASGRYLLTDDSLQSSTGFDEGELADSGSYNGDRAQDEFIQGNAIVEIEDYGLEGGGPLLEDRLWFWGSYGVQNIDLLTTQGVGGSTAPGSHDVTELESYAAKLNGQLSSNNSATFLYHYGDKIKSGRNAGPNRPAPTTWNQTGPTDIWKLEDSHVFSSDFYLTGMGSYVGGGFMLAPNGGGIGDPSFPNVTRTPSLVWQNSFLLYETDRPQEQYRADGSYFFGGGNVNHELRFGVGYRNAQVDSISVWPGQQLVGISNIPFNPVFCGGVSPCYIGWSAVARNQSDEIDYTSAFLQDTLTLGNLTANIGLRYDRQEGTNLPSATEAAPVPYRQPFSDEIIPTGGDFGGGDPGFEWTSLTPRLGLTYALGEEQETLLRASYARFADQLASGNVALTNPSNYQYGYFGWGDANGDLQLTEDEVGEFFSYVNIDPRVGGLSIISANDPDMDPPITDELLLGVEHALRPEFVVGLETTFRKYHDILEFERLLVADDAPPGDIGRPHTRDDYVLTHTLSGELPDGTAFSVPVYSLREGLSFNNGFFQTNGDREQDYLGVSLTFNKRLADRWMARGHFTWSDWEWDVPESEQEDPNEYLPGSYVDGGSVLIGSGTTSGAKGNVFINSNWAFDVSGMYQVAPDRPWGFNIAGNVNGREGYPNPWNVQINTSDSLGNRNILLVDDVERDRNEDIYVFNARLEKVFDLGDWGLTLSLDGFNLFNSGEVLQRQTNLGSTLTSVADGSSEFAGTTAGNYVQEFVSPRVFRIGARISFR